MSANQTKTISLVLGSGGARGLAHIGIIRQLEAEGYNIASISGCSIGALVGGIYAAGKLDEFESWVCAISKSDIVSLLDIALGQSGFVKGEKIINTLVKLVGDLQIEDLPIPFTAVAADIENEKEVWINSGKLFDAIRASISLPLFFTPVLRNGAHLIDGGVINPVPIAPTFNDQTDITIAVNLGGAFDASLNVTVPVEHEPKFDSFSSTIHHFINKLQQSVSPSNHSENEWGMYDVVNRAFDAMQSAIARQKLAAYPADVTIEIPKNACRMLEFDRAEEMIALGKKQAAKILSDLS